MSAKSRAREAIARPNTAPPIFFEQGVPTPVLVQPSKYLDPKSGARTNMTYKFVPVNGEGKQIPLQEYLDIEKANKEKEVDQMTPVYWALGAF